MHPQSISLKYDDDFLNFIGQLISNIKQDKGSLFSVLNTACSPQGGIHMSRHSAHSYVARYLRTTLIQPPADYNVILNRQRAVEELSINDLLFTDLGIQLKYV